MQFTDIIFAPFLIIVFVMYWLVLRRYTGLQNVLLLTVSYLFYGWWDWRFLGLIILTSATTWVSALFINRKWGRYMIMLNIILNLGILVLFKYFNFFSENLSRLFALFGMSLDWFTLDVLLPVGISFYTFQAIGYSCDVYKGRIEPCRDIISFFTFIAYFPQLVAGPIERASRLLPQISNPRTWNTAYATTGMRMIMFGLLKKLCIADILAIYVDRIFSQPEMSAAMVLVGGIAFSIEIYCDFSAYSEIARGVSRLLGIELMANFRFPYFSRNVLDFWRRWHISLMQWFRDYLYIPLGGNRKGEMRTIINSFIVFSLSGLWHGAAWNFIVWGLYWALVYVAAKFLFHQKLPKGEPDISSIPEMIFTFGAVALGFYFFRTNDWTGVLAGLKSIWIYLLAFGGGALIMKGILRLDRRIIYSLFTIFAMICVILLLLRLPHWYTLLKFWWLLPAALVAAIEWRSRKLEYPLQHMSGKVWSRLALYWVCIFFIAISEPAEMTFIYFQF